jgi:hypothetical protein
MKEAQDQQKAAFDVEMKKMQDAHKAEVDAKQQRIENLEADMNKLGVDMKQSQSEMSNQLASAQTAFAEPVANAATAIGTGKLTLTFGTATVVDGDMTVFTAGGGTPVEITIGTSNSSLTGIAAAINAKNAGVTASVLSDAGGARLVLKSATGASQAFTLTATEDAGAEGLAAFNIGVGVTGTTVSTAAQDADDVPGCARCSSLDRHALDETLVAGGVDVAARFETKLLKLRSDVLGGDPLEDSATAATLHSVAREKAELGADVLFADRLRVDRGSDCQKDN